MDPFLIFIALIILVSIFLMGLAIVIGHMFKKFSVNGITNKIIRFACALIVLASLSAPISLFSMGLLLNLLLPLGDTFADVFPIYFGALFSGGIGIFAGMIILGVALLRDSAVVKH